MQVEGMEAAKCEDAYLRDQRFEIAASQSLFVLPVHCCVLCYFNKPLNPYGMQVCCELCTIIKDPIGRGNRVFPIELIPLRAPEGSHIGGESDLGSENRRTNGQRSP